MDESKKKNNKTMWLVGMMLVFLVNLGASIYFIYAISLLNGIEDILRLIVGIVLILLMVFFFFYVRKTARKKKTVRLVIDIVLSLVYSGILIFVGGNIIKTIGKVGNLTARKTTYSASIVTLSSNKVTSIQELSSSKPIGMIKDKKSVDGYQIPQEIIKDKDLKNKIKYYDNYTDLLAELYDEKIVYIFLPSSYKTMFTSIEKYENIEKDTKVIYTQKKEVKQKVSAGKSLKKPFSVLIMGIDSDTNDLSQSSSFNGDSLMLITFNPTTLNTTILSIPRDTYVPIACFNGKRKNKITHAAWQGEQCMMDTITGFTGINIDYYVKINFKGAVQLVDSLGGIDAEVPIGFCEQNSDRAFGENTICVEAGQQHLNGEQALAWSRHRKSAGFDDFVRGQNQQLVVKAMLNKLKDVRDLDTIYKILDTVGNNMATNMTTNEILSLYNIGKDVLSRTQDMKVEDILSMQRLYISGADASIYDYSTINGQGTRMKLYNFVPYKESLAAVINAMKVNLGLTNATIEKSFAFDASIPYEEEIIGKMTRGTTGLVQLPNFIGDSSAAATSYGSRHGINVIVKGTGTRIISQSVAAGADVEFVKTLTVTLGGGPSSNTDHNSSSNSSSNTTNTPTTPSKKPDDDDKTDNTPTPTTPTPTPSEEVPDEILP